MRVFLPLVLLAALLPVPAAAARPSYTPSIGESATYACADGRTVEILYSGGDAVALTMAGRTIALDRAAAATGERYVGGAIQWWGRGARDGVLSALGDPGSAAAAGTVCRAR